MALQEYWKKRDFKQTPEPSGKVLKKNAHRFVVQKHRASHLHFDFRLEMEGVLKSWAVPKGPPLDPAEKRLAMHVEDHPVSYFDFEGIIPEGNYGAGTVMVWDVGTWEPLGDPHEMLKKGDLKFSLKGKKLNGEFVLARMRSRRPGSKGTEWLMIKKRDEAAKPGFNANDPKWDYSVLTKRSMADIGGDSQSREWQSNRAASAKSSLHSSSKSGAKTSGRGKNAWLADAIRKYDATKNPLTTKSAKNTEKKKVKTKFLRSSVSKKPSAVSPAKKKATSRKAA